MEKIIVTGANGQLGTCIKSAVSESKSENFIFTDVDELDITNKEKTKQFFKENKPDYVINCAAFTAVDQAETEREKAWEVNVEAVQNLVSACQQYNSAFIHISTDYVFDGMNYFPFREDNPACPLSFYGETKFEAENVALHYDKTLVVRTSWLYSEFGHNFLKSILRLTAEKDSLNVVFDQIGSPTYARDLAGAILHIIDVSMADKKNWEPGVFHYSNEGVCSWYDFALEIAEQSGNSCRINPIETKDYPTPARRPFYSVLNKGKIKETYKLEIPHWKHSLRNCLNNIK